MSIIVSQKQAILHMKEETMIYLKSMFNHKITRSDTPIRRIKLDDRIFSLQILL